QRNDPQRLDHSDLPQQIRSAGGDLFRTWRSVAQRPTLDDVGVVDGGWLLYRHTDRCQHRMQKHPCLTLERQAGLVVLVSWRLSDQHPVGRLGCTVAEYRLASTGMQVASDTGRYVR